MQILKKYNKYIPYVICLSFFIAYSLLSVIKHNHFLSGYDLAVSDQGVWLMSKFKNPISTPHAYPFTSLFTDHIEIIYALISPIYWFFSDVRFLIILQAFAISLSGIPIYLLAKSKKLNPFLAFSILVSFLMFFGIQNAIWADVHSLVFAASFLSWFIYFLDQGKVKLTLLFFFLAILCKEDIALLIFLISSVFYFTTRKKIALVIIGFSVLYLFLVFFVYFPHFTRDGYRFQNKNGLLSNIDLANMYDTPGKKAVLFYSFSWFGFLPLLAPIYLLPALGDLFHYFVLGSNYVASAQGMFLHYRVTLATLFAWPTIIVISKFKKLNNVYIGIYILCTAFALQYLLHLPLSYFAKRWFWMEPQSVKSINKILTYLPKDASVVSQVNITPHINHRENIFTLWPEKKIFIHDSPCGQRTCDWFRWAGHPSFLVIDTSSDWDIRHLLINKEDFAKGIQNLEKEKVIVPLKRVNTSTLYRIVKKP